ncbi:MAG: YafY family transcriptional regulator [Rhodococcus sp.]|nr:YafY family transcriptional regulator [Rhodococcus sp. (in: high G+C Gram-positive bacteria)]
MGDTGSRRLRLLSLLQTRRFWLGTELSEQLGVSLRTLRRDVDRLRELGYPVDADRGVGGGYQLAHGASLPPLVLDDEEAVAVAVGLLTSTQSPISDIAETSARALAKVIPVMPSRLRRRIEALKSVTVSAESSWSGTQIDSQALVAAARGCRDDERITFDYKTVDGTQSSRKAEPHQLVTLGRRWYLVAYDVDRMDWRTFRLDRMSSVENTGAKFGRRQIPGGDAGSFVRKGFSRNVSCPAVAEVAGSADAVRSAIGNWARVTEISAHRCRIEVDTESLDWAVATVGFSGFPVVEASPPDFADHLRAWTQRLSPPD